MKTLISGRAWVFGDNVNTDVMAPGLYFKAPMAEMAKLKCACMTCSIRHISFSSPEDGIADEIISQTFAY